VDLSVVLADDERLQQFNLQFLGVDAPTDVLAFPGGETDPDSQVEYLGDVIVSYERAQAQAASGGYSLEDELQLLVVHGVLHLLGFDHTDERSKADMWARQAEILDILGCSVTELNT
jgi:probable rRNA maturation factor